MARYSKPLQLNATGKSKPVGPTVTITNPLNGTIVSGTINLTYTKTGNITSVQWQIDGSNHSATWDTTTATNAAHTVTLLGKNRHGVTVASQTVSVTVQNGLPVPPVVNLTAPTNGATVSGTVTVSATASSNVGILRLEFFANALPIGTVNSAPYSLAWPTSTDGSYALTALATDTAGRQTTSASRTVTVSQGVIDLIPPTVSLTAPADGTIVGSQTLLTATAADNVAVASVQFAVNSVPIGTISAPPYQVLWTTSANGLIATLTARATDTAGNVTLSAPRTVTVVLPDTIPPSVTVVSPVTGTTFVPGSLPLVATATDNVAVAQVQFTVDGVNVGSPVTTSPYQITWNATAGTHVLRALATDTSGNTAGSANSVVVTITPPVDTTPPTITFTAPTEGAILGAGAYLLQAVATDNVAVTSVQFAVDGVNVGAAVTSAPYQQLWTATAGSHTLTATARDLAGNTAIATVHSQVTTAVAGLLTPGDLTYLGYFIAPTANMAFSSGALTGRRYTDGFGTNTLRLLMSSWGLSGPQSPPELIEMNYPGVGTSLTNGDSGAPTASLLRSWNSLTNRTTPQLIADPGSAVVVRGLGYVGNLGTGPAVVIGYSSSYQTNSGDPSILVTAIQDNGTTTSYGPWFNRNYGPVHHGQTGLVPSAFQATTGCGPFWSLNSNAGTAASQTGGAHLVVWNTPALATPADVPSGTFNVSGAVTARPCVTYGSTTPQPRTFTNCLYDTGSIGFSGCPGSSGDPMTHGGGYFGGNIPNPDQVTNPTNIFGGSTNPPLDWYDTAVWIATATKRGLLCLGQFAEGVSGYAYKTGDGKNHFWYGSYRSCTASSDNGTENTTGPQTETLVNTWSIFDPNDFVAVLAGSRPAYGTGAPVPVNTFTPGLLLPPFPVLRRRFRQFMGAYFDATSGLLFLSESLHTGAYDYSPAIHVFQVAT